MLPTIRMHRFPYCQSLSMLLLVLVAAGALGCRSVKHMNKHYIPTWTASPQEPGAEVFAGKSLEYRTLRQIVHVSLGGTALRIRLSNEHTSAPLTIGAAAMGHAGEGPSLKAGTASVAITFAGRSEVTIPARGAVVSDAAELPVESGADLAVSLYFPGQPPDPTLHACGFQTAFISGAGNHVAAPTFVPIATTDVRVALSAVLVETDASARVIVAFGDSITDGALATPNANRRWPDLLARRLREAFPEQRIAVANQGIGGNRLLRDGAGISGLARLDRDALDLEGISHLILLEGINDIGWPLTPADPSPLVPAEEVIAGYREVIARAHARGVKVIGATLLPFERALEGSEMGDYYLPAKEVQRQAINAFIRTSGAFDAFVDFDQITRDPEHPTRLRAEFDSGDHLHPSDAGMQAMADAIDLGLLME